MPIAIERFPEFAHGFVQRRMHDLRCDIDHGFEHVRATNEIGAWDIHTPHWHGQTVVANHMRTDMIMLTPMMTAMADMVPDNPGMWLFHCHMPGHFSGGMYARFNVLPAAAR